MFRVTKIKRIPLKYYQIIVESLQDYHILIVKYTRL